MEVEDLARSRTAFCSRPGGGAEQVAQQHRPAREGRGARRKRGQERMQVPRAGGDVEDRVPAGREVPVELRRARERRARQRRPGDGLPDHQPDALDPGLEDGVVDVGDDAEPRPGPGTLDLERGRVLAGQAAVGAGELDGAGGPGRRQPAGSGWSRTRT